MIWEMYIVDGSYDGKRADGDGKSSLGVRDRQWRALVKDTELPHHTSGELESIAKSKLEHSNTLSVVNLLATEYDHCGSVGCLKNYPQIKEHHIYGTYI